MAALGAGAEAAADSVERKSGDLYELRLDAEACEQDALDDYLSKAYLPALKRCGVGPVGVFVDRADETLKYYVLAVHPTAESIVDLGGRLTADEKYRQAAAKYLAAGKRSGLFPHRKLDARRYRGGAS